MDNHLQRPEIIDARDTGAGMASRFSQTLQQQMMYRAVAVSSNQQSIGYVRVSLPLTTIDNRLQQLRSIVLLSAGIVAIVALILGFYFAHRFTEPLLRMTAAATAISQGDPMTGSGARGRGRQSIAAGDRSNTQERSQ